MNDIVQKYFNYIDEYFSADKIVDRFYHYTDIGALINGIIPEYAEQGKEVCMRATHAKFLNDPEEIKRGIDFLREVFEKNHKNDEFLSSISKYNGNSFLISFTQEKDSLPMWTTYANKSTGVAIGFERLKSLSFTDLVLKCWYDIGELSELIEQYIHLGKKKVDPILYIFCLPQIYKDKAYEYEKEIRLIGEFKDLPAKFREKNGYIIPYKEVFFAKEQIKSMTLGPCQNMDNAEYSLRQFLDSRGFEHVEIKRSEIPYRNI